MSASENSTNPKITLNFESTAVFQKGQDRSSKRPNPSDCVMQPKSTKENPESTSRKTKHQENKSKIVLRNTSSVSGFNFLGKYFKIIDKEGNSEVNSPKWYSYDKHTSKIDPPTKLLTSEDISRSEIHDSSTNITTQSHISSSTSPMSIPQPKVLETSNVKNSYTLLDSKYSTVDGASGPLNSGPSVTEEESHITSSYMSEKNRGIINSPKPVTIATWFPSISSRGESQNNTKHINLLQTGTTKKHISNNGVPEENMANRNRDVDHLTDAKSTSVYDTCVSNSKHHSIESHETERSFSGEHPSNHIKLNESGRNYNKDRILEGSKYKDMIQSERSQKPDSNLPTNNCNSASAHNYVNSKENSGLNSDVALINHRMSNKYTEYDLIDSGALRESDAACTSEEKEQLQSTGMRRSVLKHHTPCQTQLKHSDRCSEEISKHAVPQNTGQNNGIQNGDGTNFNVIPRPHQSSTHEMNTGKRLHLSPCPGIKRRDSGVSSDRKNRSSRSTTSVASIAGESCTSDSSSSMPEHRCCCPAGCGAQVTTSHLTHFHVPKTSNPLYKLSMFDDVVVENLCNTPHGTIRRDRRWKRTKRGNQCAEKGKDQKENCTSDSKCHKETSRIGTSTQIPRQSESCPYLGKDDSSRELKSYLDRVSNPESDRREQKKEEYLCGSGHRCVSDVGGSSTKPTSLTYSDSNSSKPEPEESNCFQKKSTTAKDEEEDDECASCESNGTTDTSGSSRKEPDRVCNYCRTGCHNFKDASDLSIEVAMIFCPRLFSWKNTERKRKHRTSCSKYKSNRRNMSRSSTSNKLSHQDIVRWLRKERMALAHCLLHAIGNSEPTCDCSCKEMLDPRQHVIHVLLENFKKRDLDSRARTQNIEKGGYETPVTQREPDNVPVVENGEERNGVSSGSSSSLEWEEQVSEGQHMESRKIIEDELVTSHRCQHQRPQNIDPVDDHGNSIYEVELQNHRQEFPESSQFKQLTTNGAPTLYSDADTIKQTLTRYLPAEPSTSYATKPTSVTDTLRGEQPFTSSNMLPSKVSSDRTMLQVLKTTGKDSINASGVPYRESKLIESGLDSESQTSSHNGTSPGFIFDKPGLSTATRESLYGTHVGGETAADTSTGTKPKSQPYLRYTVNKPSEKYTSSLSPRLSNLDGYPKHDEDRELAHSADTGNRRQSDITGIGCGHISPSRKTSAKTTSVREYENPVVDDSQSSSSTKRLDRCEQIVGEAPSRLTFTSTPKPMSSPERRILSNYVNLFDLSQVSLEDQNESKSGQKRTMFDGVVVLANKGDATTRSSDMNISGIEPITESRCSSYISCDEEYGLHHRKKESSNESTVDEYVWPTIEVSEQRLASESHSRNRPRESSDYRKTDEERTTPRYSGCSASYLNNRTDKNASSEMKEKSQVNSESTSKSVKVLWAVTRINIFQDESRTYEIMEPREEPPPWIPETSHCIIVLVPKKD